MLLTNYGPFHYDLIHHGIEYAAEHTASLGFNAVEFLGGYPSQIPAFQDLGEAEHVAEVLKSYGLKTSCFSAGVNLYGENMAEVEKTLCRYAEIAAIVGAPYLHHTVYLALELTPTSPSYETVFSSTIDAIERIARHAASLGVTCIYEPQGMYFNGIAGLEPLVKEMKSRVGRVGVCGDVGNPLYADADPVGILEKVSSDVLHVHIKDYYYRKGTVTGEGWRPSRAGNSLMQTEIGIGDIDLVGCLRALQAAEYKGAYAFEIPGGDDEMTRRAVESFKSLYCSVFGV